MPRFEPIRPWKDSKVEIEKKEKAVAAFIKKINRKAWVPITSDAWRYLSEIMAPYQSHPVWNRMVVDRSVTKHFSKPNLDPSMGCFFIDVRYLEAHRGNPLSDFKFDHVKKNLDRGVKMEAPHFELPRGTVGEGNHRVAMMSKLGYRAVPVTVYW